MKKIVLVLALLTTATFLSGCLKVERMAFTVTPATDSTGTCTIEAFGITSDAIGNTELDQDKSIITDMLEERAEFLEYMESFGKTLVSKEAKVVNGKLNGKIVYKYRSLKDVEGLMADKEFFYLTAQPNDSLITKSGVIVKSGDRKRIMWEKKSTKSITFERIDNSESRKKDLTKFFTEYTKNKK